MAPISTNAAPGDVDPTFNPMPGTDGTINSLVLQSDGKVVIGGGFFTVNGVSRNRVARLNGDGSLDLGFDVGSGPAARVNTLALQSDGKILVGGDFSNFSGIQHAGIVRLNSDGSLDTSFDPGTGVANDLSMNLVSAIAIQGDGKILIGGEFTSANGVLRNRIARLNSDGGVDETFDPGTGIEGYASVPGGFLFNTVYAIAVDSDGKIYLGGAFNQYDGDMVPSIVRLNSDGTRDTGFSVGSSQSGIVVYDLRLQSDGKPIIGGIFEDVGGVLRNNIARLTTNGGVDMSFSTGIGVQHKQGEIPVVFTLGLDSDGKVVLGGSYSTVSGFSRNGIARLNTDGSLDTDFDPGAGLAGSNGFAGRSLAVQSDDKIILGGRFATVDGLAYSNVVRLQGKPGSTGPVETPEILDATFEDGVFTVSLMSEAGVTYFLQYKDSVVDAEWTTIEPGTVGTGDVITLSDPDAGANYRFYQVIAMGEGGGGGGNGGEIQPPDLAAPSLADGAFSLSLQSEQGRSYTLQYKDTVNAAQWISILPPTTGTGDVITLTDMVDAEVPQRFYQVIVE